MSPAGFVEQVFVGDDVAVAHARFGGDDELGLGIVDAGGHLLYLNRLDGAAPLSAHIAPAKANTAALGQRESKVYEDMVNGGRSAFLSAPLLTSLEGGVPVIVDGQVIGAVGVSGVKADQDAQIAKAGAESLNGK